MLNDLNIHNFLLHNVQSQKEHECHLRRLEELRLHSQHEKSDSEIVSETEIPFSYITKSKNLHKAKTDFKIPCRITSRAYGKRNESKKSQGRKTSKIYSAFKMKEEISKSSINTENEFSRISSKTNLESNLSFKFTENLNKTPVNIQISMKGGDSNSALKFVVEVPSRVLEVLRCGDTKINNSESISSTNTKSRNRKSKRNRLKSIFFKLLQNKKTKSCTSTSTKQSSSITKSEIFSSEMEIPENPLKDINPSKSFSALSEFTHSHAAYRTSGILNTEFCNSDVEETNKSEYKKEFYENKAERKTFDPSERKLTLENIYSNFLENQHGTLYSENGNPLSYFPENFPKSKKNVEIPIDVKITKFPLFLKKSYHSYKNRANLLRKEELLEILTANVPEEVLDKYFTDNIRRFGPRSTFLTDDKNSVEGTSTFEYLLQNFKDVRERRVVNLRQPAEKDWHQVMNFENMVIFS